MNTLLWLDDYRDPNDNDIDWLVFSPIGRKVNIIWVKDYYEFIKWITENGLPQAICFDHDLGDDSFDEKTGYDAAKWLVNYCMDNNIGPPIWNIQSANTVGRENINRLLNNFLKYAAVS